jgi:hypothetical protein
VKPHFLDGCAVRVVPAEPTDVASAAVTATMTTAAKIATFVLLTTPPLRLGRENTDR